MPEESLKVLKITDKASKKGLQEMLAHEAASRGWGILRLTAMIIEDALKDQSKYDEKKLAHPLPGEGKEILCKLPISLKKKFKDWASASGRNQSQHACFIFEKWCEYNNLVPLIV